MPTALPAVVHPRPPVSRWLHPASGASVPVLQKKSRCCLWRYEPDHYRQNTYFQRLFSDGFRHHIEPPIDGQHWFMAWPSIFTSASPSADVCGTPPCTAAGEWFAMKCSNMAVVDARPVLPYLILQPEARARFHGHSGGSQLFSLRLSPFPHPASMILITE